MKKLFALLLAVVMVMGLVACTTTPADNDTTPNDPVDKDPVTEKVTVTFPLEEEVTFKVVSTTYQDMAVTEGLANNKLWNEIYEKTNVKIEFNWITAAQKADRLQQLQNHINAGTVGDAVLCTFMDDASISSMVANDQILAITEYVDNAELMPNLHKNVFGSEPGIRGNWTFPDGEVYVLGQYTGGFSTDAMWYINKAWLDKAQMEIPTTWEQLEAVLKYFNENDMNENGKDDEIPLMVHTTQNYSLPSHWMGCWGISCKDSTTDSYCYIEDDGETVGYVPMTENWKAMVTKFKEWADAGILYDGWEKDTAAVRELYRGEGDSLVGIMTYDQGKTSMRNADDYVMFCPPAAPGYELEIYNHPALKYGGKNIAFLMKDCKNPEILLAWLDLFYDDEVSVRNKYGEFDSVYVKLDENGKVAEYVTPDANWWEGNKRTNSSLHHWLDLPYCYTKNTYENIFSPSVSAATEELREMYGEYANPTPWPRPYFSADDSTLVAEVRADINTLTGEWYANFVTGKKSIENDWDEWLDALDRAGIEQYLEGHQNAYDNWLSGQQ